MINTTNIKREFTNNINKMYNFEKKIGFLEKSKQFRLQELEKIPEERKKIREKAKELYDLSQEYQKKGLKRQYELYMNEASRKVKSLKKVSRFRKRKEIHTLNRYIREVESRIEPLREDRIEQESIIKDILFQEFMGAN